MATFPLKADDRFSADVVVIGDGLAAVAAALEARAAGKRVLLAAPGTAVASEVTVALHGEIGDIEEPHFAAIRDRVATLGGEHSGWLDAPITEMVVDRTLAEQGVELLLYSIPISLIEEDGEALGVLMGGKDGFYTIAAGAIVDATGDGALFRRSGVAFEDLSAITAARTVYYQFAGDDLCGLPEEVAGLKLRARRTWPAEVCVSMTGEAGFDGGAVPAELHHASRLAAQEVSRALIASVPALQDAVVSHTGHQMLPLSSAHLSDANPQHPGLPSVFGAGAWVQNQGHGDLATLAMSGHDAGALAARNCARIPRDVRVEEDAFCEEEQVDVAVAGGGTGGPFAALASARNGASTMVIEAGWFLGGIGAGGGIHIYYHGVPGGLQDLIDEHTNEIADALGGRDKVAGFHPEAKKIALERALIEAGVDIRYGATVADVVMEGDRISGIVVVSPGKVTIVRAKVVVDGTGDADIAAGAGVPIMHGRPSDGLSHQYSQSSGCFRNGLINHNNFDAGYVDGTDIADLTRARRHGLQLYWKADGLTPDTRLLHIAPLLGLRQSRHIIGEYVLTMADQVANTHFDDVVAYGKCHQDNHALDYENESDEAMMWAWVLGFWHRHMRHELPYRCLLPQGIDNLIVACRGISLSRDAHMLFRMMPDMQRIGEAAGVAAALAADADLALRDVDIVQLQGKLRETGALLDDWEGPEPLQPPDELIKVLAAEAPSIASWRLYQQGDDAVPALLGALHSEDENARWWAAAILAMLGCEEAAEELLGVLQRRDDRLPTTDPNTHQSLTRRMAPRWVAAIALLGKLKSRRAAPAIAEVLTGSADDPDVLIGAMRALARIGDPRSVERLRTFIARDDLSDASAFVDALSREDGGGRDTRPARGGAGYEPPPYKGPSWQIQLGAADALKQLGAPMPELAQPWLSDPRAYVRSYARRIAK